MKVQEANKLMSVVAVAALKNPLISHLDLSFHQQSTENKAQNYYYYWVVKRLIERLETHYLCLVRRLVFFGFFILQAFFRVVIFVVRGDGFVFTMVFAANIIGCLHQLLKDCLLELFIDWWTHAIWSLYFPFCFTTLDYK